MSLLEVELPAGSLVIGDLHLDVDAGATSPDGLQLEAFLDAHRAAPVLVILGDLFEYWLGPSHAKSRGGRSILELIGRLPGAVYLIPGNRDVLAGDELEAAGIRVAKHGLLGTVPGGERLLLLHGDELSIHDTSYQRQRRILRNPILHATLRHLPGLITRALARRLRAHSMKATPAKAPLEVAQDPGEAARRLAATNAQTLVAGHAHRFRDELLSPFGRLIILDAFGGERDVLRIEEQAGLTCISSAGAAP